MNDKKVCPMHNKFPNGCINWRDNNDGWHDGKYCKGNCRFDETKYNHSPDECNPSMIATYGPFYVKTKCCRIGGIYEKDEYQQSNDYNKIVDELIYDINIEEMLKERFEEPPEEWNGNYNQHMLSIYHKLSKKFNEKYIEFCKKHESDLRRVENLRAVAVDKNGHILVDESYNISNKIETEEMKTLIEELKNPESELSKVMEELK